MRLPTQHDFRARGWHTRTFGFATPPSVVALTDTSATITWSMTEPCQGWVEYGLTSALGTTSSVESSYTYSSHRQVLGGLALGTTYYYQTVSVSVDAMTVRSDIDTFVTEGSTSVIGTEYAVPGSIDATGATNVSAALASWIATTVPNGTVDNPSLLVFPSTATYRCDTWLAITNRSFLHFYGFDPATNLAGVTESTPRCIIRNNGGAQATNSAFGIVYAASSNIKIVGFDMYGGNPTGGTTSAYHPGQESASGVWAYSNGGAHHNEVAYNIIRDQWGHGVYVRANDGLVQPDNYYIHHNFILRVGVMGVAISNGTNHRIEDNEFRDIALYGFDFEDANVPSYLSDISIKRNLFHDNSWSSAYPAPDWCVGVYPSIVMTNITIEDNTFTGTSHSYYDPNWYHARGIIYMSGLAGSTNVIIRNNVSTYAKDGVQVQAANINGLTVTGNSFTGSAIGWNGVDHADVVLSATNCTNVVNTGNTLA